ncbi:hypothetical protein [Streptomyces sp. NBC_01358]|uniref:hypothetical protein n=1 Tax=Streptomyces sp. NBC_01358 TaxID=2903837 RepID=UPI002E380678|nr:hypothetical protein [Streptomyces sp. NBC_01358]
MDQRTASDAVHRKAPDAVHRKAPDAVHRKAPDAVHRKAPDAVHRKAERRPRTGCIRVFRQRGVVPQLSSCARQELRDSP